MRKATVKRETKETKISVSLNLDGSGKGTVETGIGFFNRKVTMGVNNFCKVFMQQLGDLSGELRG